MSKLMVHGLEEVLVHHVEVAGVEVVGVVEGNLQTALGHTECLGTLRGVVVLRTDYMDDARAVGLKKFGGAVFLIHVEPQILAQHGQVYALVVVGRRKVLLHVGADVFHAVDHLHIVGLEEVCLQEGVEREGVGCAVERMVDGIEDGGTEIVVIAARHETGSGECQGTEQYVSE